MNEHDFYKDVIMNNLADKEEIRETVLGAAKSKRSVGRGFAKWMCAAAAALVLVAGVSFAIPEARAAILSWFDPGFRPEQYLVTPTAEREVIPEIEEAIEDVSGQAVTVELVEFEDGYEDWAKALAFTFDDVLYDGEKVYISGSATGDLTPVFANYGSVGDDIEQLDSMVYAAIGEHKWYDGIEGEPYSNGRLEFDPDVNNISMVSTGEPYRFTDDSIARMKTEPCRFTIDLPVFDELSGEQAVSLDLYFNRMAEVSRDEQGITSKAVPVAKFRVEGLSFDAAAGEASKITLAAPVVEAMSGEVSVNSIHEPDGDTITIGNEVLSLDGGTFELIEVHKKLTGMDVTVKITPPKSWTEWQKQCFYGQLDYDIIINGDEQGGFGSAFGSVRGIGPDGDWSSCTEQIGDIRILEQDIAGIESFQLRLKVHELTEYNGVKVPREGSVKASYDESGWNEDTKKVTLDAFMLDIPVR